MRAIALVLIAGLTGCGAKTEPSAAPEPERKVADAPPPKAKARADKRPIAPPQKVPPAGPPAGPPPLTFETSYQKAKDRVAKFREEGEAQMKRIRLLSADERAAAQVVIDAAKANTVDGTSDDFAALGELSLGRWAGALAMDRALNSREFEAVARVVWERTPTKHGVDSFLVMLMFGWGRAGPELQADAVAFFTKPGRRVEDLPEDAKKRLIEFAGEDALLNGP